MKALSTIFIFIALATSFQLIPKLRDADIIWGQVGKQSVAAEMARSLLMDQREGVFPIRHFMEIYHDHPVPWAEEVPIYSFINQGIARLTSLNVVVVGRIHSFAAFIFLIFGFFKLGSLMQENILTKRKERSLNLPLNWIFALLALSFPVFRIYSVSIMPDLPMAATLVWTWVFALQGRWKSAALMGAFACAFKYYAAFSILGILVWRLRKNRDPFKSALWGFCVTAPTLAYLVYFLLKGIPNPITEYPIWNGGGHVGMQMLFSLGWYARLVTWLVVKNPGLPAGLLACLGFLLLWKKRSDFNPQFLYFISTQFAAGLLFITLFSTSFYVHDYYGLQWALLEVVAAGIAFHTLATRAATKKSQAVLAALGISIAVFGGVRTHSATIPQNYFRGFSEFLKANSTPESFGLVFAERPVESSLFSASRSAWVVHLNRWSTPAKSAAALDIQSSGYASVSMKTEQLIDQRLKDPRLKWVALFTVDEKRDDLVEKIKKHLDHAGFQAGVLMGKPIQVIEKDFQPQHPRDSSAHLVWIQRNK